MSKGLYDKFYVERKESGKPVEKRCFVLMPESDPCAVGPLRVYALCTHNAELRRDLLRWVSEIENGDPDEYTRA